MSAESFSQTWQLTAEALKKWGLVWFSPFQLAWLLAIIIIGVAFRRKTASAPPRQLDKWLLFSFAGVGMAYFLLMLRQFIDHDYYALDGFYPALLFGAALGTMATQRIRWVFGLECLLLVGALFWASELIATAAFFQQGKKMAIVEKPVRLRQGNAFLFRSTDLLIPAVEADEMRIYLWNPGQRKVKFQAFRVSVILPKFRSH